MALFTYDSQDAELIRDFANDYQDLYESAESHILRLERNPSDSDSLNALFRAVHTVKGNCGLLGITPLIELLQELESVLDMVRHGEIPFQALIGDLTLLILDRCTGFIGSLSRNLEAEYDSSLFRAVSTQLDKAVNTIPSQQVAMLTKTLSLLDPSTLRFQDESDHDELLYNYGITPSEDLVFAMQLAQQTQSRAAFWQGRIERVIQDLMSLNEYAGQPVDPEQLIVAVCFHDIGMAMLPSAVINKDTPLTEDEFQSVKDHVWVASRLVSSFPDWRSAKKIIDHHQENFDGSGYPLNLKGDEICDGAQMLAVVHAFEAITHGYSKDVNRKRPLMRAVMELNRHSGTQFNPKWVQLFLELRRAGGEV
jgi:HD-GYP domain-containing protein (c-di-GMP phosphodiesterase class II)